MSNPIPDHALVVVADGGKATFYRRTGKGPSVTLQPEEQVAPDTATEQGPSGARPAEQSSKQTAEAGFVNRLVHTLDTMHGHGKFKDLVLVADPQTMGQIRGAMHKALEGTVVRSVSKDLTNHPLKAIESALSE